MVGHIQYCHLGTRRRRCRLITGPEESGLDPLSPVSVRIPAVVSHHLKILLRDMLSDGGDEFFGREDLEVLLVAPVSHAGAVEDFAGVLQVGDLLLGEGIPQDVFRQGLLPVSVVPGDLISGMHAETTVMPDHAFFDEHLPYSAFSLEHDRDAEDEMSMGHGMENVVGDIFSELSASVGRTDGVIASFMES